MTPPVDIGRLEAFCDGTTEGFRLVVDIFLSDTLETLTELYDAVARSDSDAIRLLAHRAGGSSAACGASALATLLERLESSAGVAAGADESLLARQVTTEFEAVTQFLRAYVEGQLR